MNSCLAFLDVFETIWEKIDGDRRLSLSGVF